MVGMDFQNMSLKLHVIKWVNCQLSPGIEHFGAFTHLPSHPPIFRGNYSSNPHLFSRVDNPKCWRDDPKLNPKATKQHEKSSNTIYHLVI